MSRYLQKFVGKYRVLAEYDQNTKDFIRDECGNIDSSFNDLYIPCSPNGKISYLERGILQYYVPSLRRGRNIVRDIKENKSTAGIIFDIDETDSELTFKFKANDIEKLEDILSPKTHGSTISPFSVKNLPKERYIIPEEDDTQYKNLIDKVFDKNDNGRLNKLLNIGRAFLTEHKVFDQCKKSRLGYKNFIHKIGKWNEYLDYIEEKGALDA